MCGEKSRVRKKKKKEKERSVGKINKTPTPNPSAKETINHLSPSYILSLFLCGVDKQKDLLGTSLPSEHIHTQTVPDTHTKCRSEVGTPDCYIQPIESCLEYYTTKSRDHGERPKKETK